jgi:hypothetical protein
MPDYNKTKIYYIAVGDDRYYGHTTMALSKRRNAHQFDFIAKPHRKLYKAMREAGMTQYDIKMEHVEDYPCTNRNEATLREKHWADSFGTLNDRTPNCPEEERKEKEKASKRAYREAHPEKVKAKKADEYRRHKDRYKASHEAWTASNRERKRATDKAYDEANKEKAAAQGKARYEANKDKILASNKARREAKLEKYKEREQKYREAHRERQREYMKIYYLANKDKWSKKTTKTNK